MLPPKIKKILTTTSSERRGIFFLLLLLFLLVIFYAVEDILYKSPPEPVRVEQLAEIEEIVKKQKKTEGRNEKTVLFKFNPNTISKEEWMKLGFSTKQAQAIVNYKKTGGVFKQKKDLKKLFVVSDKKYQELLPYIDLPIVNKQSKATECYQYRVFLVSDTVPIYKGLENIGSVYYKKQNGEYKYYTESFEDWKIAEGRKEEIIQKGIEGAFVSKLSCSTILYPIKQRKKESKEQQSLPIVEINSADTTELKTLKGVGSYYAKKIVDYRTKLGGFYKKEQLLEIYRINPDILELNKKRIEIDTTLIRKINVNTATKEELKAHPYIKWQVANSIVLYRANHGKYKSVKNIQNSDLVNDELYRKIVRYLTVEE